MQAEDRDAYVADDTPLHYKTTTILDVYQEAGADIWRRPPTRITAFIRSLDWRPEPRAGPGRRRALEAAEPHRAIAPRRPSRREAPAPSIPGDEKWKKSCRLHTTKNTRKVAALQ